MAWDFDSGDWLTRDDAALKLVAQDYSVHHWVYPDASFFSGVWRGAGAFAWLLDGAAGGKLNTQTNSGNSYNSTGNIPANQWSAVGLSYGSGHARKLWLNGVKTEGSSVGVNAEPDNIFELGRAAQVVYSDARFAHYAIWAAELSEAEFAALAGGTPPTMIRPSALLAYWPLWLASSTADISGNRRNLTSGGTPTSYPSKGAPVGCPFPV
jgi:hypothetical protein